MTWFRRNKPERVHIWLTDAETGEAFQTSASPRAAAALAELNTEAVEMAKATQAMAEHNHREHQRLQRRIQALTDIKASLHAQVDGLQQELRRTKEAIAVAQHATDEARGELLHALAEVKKLDGKLVAAETDLGREREDHRAFMRRWANHLNNCPVADELAAEDYRKEVTNR